MAKLPRRTEPSPCPAWFRLPTVVKIGGYGLGVLLAVSALASLYIAWLEAPRRAALGEIAVAQEAYLLRRLAPGGVPRYGTLEELERAGVVRPGLGWCADTRPATDAPGECW